MLCTDCSVITMSSICYETGIIELETTSIKIWYFFCIKRSHDIPALAITRHRFFVEITLFFSVASSKERQRGRVFHLLAHSFLEPIAILLPSSAVPITNW